MLQREFTTCLHKNPQKNYDKDNGDDIVIVLIIFNSTWVFHCKFILFLPTEIILSVDRQASWPESHSVDFVTLGDRMLVFESHWNWGPGTRRRQASKGPWTGFSLLDVVQNPTVVFFSFLRSKSLLIRYLQTTVYVFKGAIPAFDSILK